MDSLISLAALLEPQVLDPFVRAPRITSPPDFPELADLYRVAFAGEAVGLDAAKATARINAILDGALGTPIPRGCLVTLDTERRLTAAIVTTERAFRRDKPKTAFIAELFTHPAYRRQGLAKALLNHAMQALYETGHKTLAVTVNSSNTPAMALFLSQDFRRFSPAIPID